MVLDTSALSCMIRREPEATSFLRAIQRDAVRLLSAVSFIEAGIVLERQFRAQGSRELEFTINALGIQIEPVAAEQGRFALLAYWGYGKSIHPAALSFGDCFSYALAKSHKQPLLFKGEDFSKTDIRKVRITSAKA